MPAPTPARRWMLVLALVASLAGLAAALSLPWLSYPAAGSGSGSRTVGWMDLQRPTATAYERVLLWAPLVAFAASAVCAAALLRLPSGRAQSFLWLALAGASFALALCGTRWAGFAIARWLDRGPTLVELHVVPWLTLGLGSAGLALSLPRLRGLAPAWLGRAVAASGAALLGLPLLPAATSPGGAFHYDELTLELMRVTGTPEAQAAAQWAYGRWVLSASLAVFAVAMAWGIARPPKQAAPAWARAVLAAAAVAALAFEALFLRAVARDRDLSAAFNPFLAGAALAFAALAAFPGARRSGASKARGPPVESELTKTGRPLR